jgi:hypothetical protein
MTDPLSTEQVAALKQKAEAACPGPWKPTVVVNGSRFYHGAGPELINRAAATADAAHIAANSPDVTLRLIHDLEDARAERDSFDELLAHSNRALVNICKALGVPLDWHAEPFPAEEDVLRAIADLTQQVTRLREERDKVWLIDCQASTSPPEEREP